MKKSWKLLVSVLAVILIVAAFSFLGGVQVGRSEFAGVGDSIPKGNEINFPFSYLIDTNSTHYFLGNGTTWKWEDINSNSTYIFQQSIKANVTVAVKPGQYSLDNLLTINVNGYHLVGSGWSTQVNVGANGGFNLTSTSSFRDIRFEKVHFEGNGVATRVITSAMPTGQKRIQDITITHNWFFNFQTANAVLNLTNLESSEISYNRFYRTKKSMILLTSNDYDTGNTQIFGNYFFFGYDYANENAITLLTLKYATKGSIFETWVTQNQFYSPIPGGGGKSRPLSVNATTYAGAIETIHMTGNRIEASQAIWTSDNSTYKVRKILFSSNYVWTDSTQSNMKIINLDADTRSSIFEGNEFQIESSTSYYFLSNRTDASYNNIFRNNELYSSSSPTFSPGRKTIVSGNVGLGSLYTVKVNGTNNIAAGSDLSNFGATGAMAQKTKYTIENNDVYLTVSGGTVSNIIIYDSNSNVYADLGSSCSAIRIPVFWILNITYSAKPTITLLWVD